MEQIILDYIKALAWPIVVVFSLVFFRGELTRLFGGSNLKLDIFGVTIDFLYNPSQANWLLGEVASLTGSFFVMLCP